VAGEIDGAWGQGVGWGGARQVTADRGGVAGAGAGGRNREQRMKGEGEMRLLAEPGGGEAGGGVDGLEDGDGIVDGDAAGEEDAEVTALGGGGADGVGGF
jgi:hypothetical protein